MRFITVLMIIQRNAGTALRGRVVIFTIGATVLTIFVAALAVYDAEAGQGGGIDTFGDAIWWAFETITTVGYGDLVPVTITGRIVAVGLMIGGVAIIGVVSASLASWIVERVAGQEGRRRRPGGRQGGRQGGRHRRALRARRRGRRSPGHPGKGARGRNLGWTPCPCVPCR